MSTKGAKRDMWKNITWKRRNQIRDKIWDMPDGIRKTILTLAFLDEMSTAEIEELAKTRSDLHSRNHRPISRRRILQIIAEEIPDYNAYRKHNQNQGRKDHSEFIRNHKKTDCVLCGSSESVEFHHMIPVALGGTAEPENMICLCKECHNAVSAYQARILKK